MGYSVPETQCAPALFLESYPQAYPQGRAGLWITVSQQERGPPVAEFCRRGRGTPQQKIFAKVKAAIWPLTCGFSTVM